MFCENCGKQIGNGRLCPECAVALGVAPQPPVAPEAPAAPQPPVVPVYAEAPAAPEMPAAPEVPVAPEAPIYAAPEVPVPPVTEEAPVYAQQDTFTIPEPTPEAPGFTVGAPQEATAKPEKKKGKGKAVVLSIVAVVLVAAIVLAIFNWAGIVRFFKRIFTDPTEYLIEVEKTNASEAAGQLVQGYDEALANMQVTDTAGKTAVTLEMGETTRALLGTLLANEGMEVDLSWVESVSLSVDYNIKDNLAAMDIGVSLNGTYLVTVQVVMDMDALKMYLAIPELNKSFLLLDMEEMLGEDAQAFREAMAESQEMSAQLAAVLPTGEQVEDLINRYLGILFDSLEDVEKETKTVEVGEVSQSLLVMTAEFSEKDLLKVFIDIIEEAIGDKVLKELVDNLGQTVGESLYEEFQAALQEAKQELEMGLDEVSSKTLLTVDTYLDGEDNIAGRTFTVEVDGEKVTLSYLTVRKGDAFATEAKMTVEGVSIKIEGEGTVKDGKTTGTYTLRLPGYGTVATLEVENFSYTAEAATGTLRLTPEDSFYEMLDLDTTVLSMLGGNLSFEISMDSTAEEGSVSFAILAGKLDLLRLTMDASVKTPATVTVPEDAKNASNPRQLTQWTNGLTADAFLENLEKAGIPADFLESLVDALFA